MLGDGRIFSAHFMICSEPRACSAVAAAICCTVSAMRSMASVTCLRAAACSTVARAMARTMLVDFWRASRIFFERALGLVAEPHAVVDVLAPRSTAAMAFFDSALHGLDELGDLLGARAGALGEVLDLVGDDREALAVLAGLRGDDRGVEREEVGLLGDVVDHVEDLADGLDARSRGSR